MTAIYHVKTPAGDRLIKAGSKSVAINHAVKSLVEAKSDTATEMADLMASGLVIEEAGKAAIEAKSTAEEGGERDAA